MIVVAATLLAGAAGAVARFLVTRAFSARPVWAVLVVNVVGSAIAGALLALTSGDARLILLTGFCGGLTTFSTFGVETIQLLLGGRARVALASVLANLVLGVGAASAIYLLLR
jgi:CrcB protein